MDYGQPPYRPLIDPWNSNIDIIADGIDQGFVNNELFVDKPVGLGMYILYSIDDEINGFSSEGGNYSIVSKVDNAYASGQYDNSGAVLRVVIHANNVELIVKGSLSRDGKVFEPPMELLQMSVYAPPDGFAY